MRSAWGFLLVAACSDPVVQLSLKLPDNASGYDTSCLSSVDTYVDGTGYPGNMQDYTLTATDIGTAPSTLADLTTTLSGKIDVSIPPSGIGWIEIYGWNGQSVFETGPSGELVFDASTKYSGEDTVTLDITPNISCVHKPVTVRPLDLVAYITTTDPALKCASAKATTGTIYMGTMFTETIIDETDYIGGLQTGSLTAAGTASIMGSTTMGPNNCLAFSVELGGISALSCAVYGGGLCSSNGEYEVAMISDTVATNSRDTAVLSDFAGMVFGGLFSPTKAALAGATITLDDPTLGKVVYVDFDVATQKMVPNAGQSTSASGLFILYTNDVVGATIAAPGMAPKKVLLGAVDESGTGGPPAPSTFSLVMTAQ